MRERFVYFVNRHPLKKTYWYITGLAFGMYLFLRIGEFILSKFLVNKIGENQSSIIKYGFLTFYLLITIFGMVQEHRELD